MNKTEEFQRSAIFQLGVLKDLLKEKDFEMFTTKEGLAIKLNIFKKDEDVLVVELKTIEQVTSFIESATKYLS